MKSNTPLTLNDLMQVQCEDPDCNCRDKPEMFFHAQCHPSSPSWVHFDKRDGCVYVECAECKNPIATVAVAQENGVMRISRFRDLLREQMAAHAKADIEQHGHHNIDGENYRLSLEFLPLCDKRGQYCLKVFCRVGESDEYEYDQMTANIRFWPRFYHSIEHAVGEACLWLDANGGLKGDGV